MHIEWIVVVEGVRDLRDLGRAHAARSVRRALRGSSACAPPSRGSSQLTRAATARGQQRDIDGVALFGTHCRGMGVTFGLDGTLALRAADFGKRPAARSVKHGIFWPDNARGTLCQSSSAWATAADRLWRVRSRRCSRSVTQSAAALRATIEQGDAPSSLPRDFAQSGGWRAHQRLGAWHVGLAVRDAGRARAPSAAV